ncbi:NUDIX hydrolase [Aquibium carbonis]|uniref:NUDIX hydrolase n=1 Tax=Aquibium carbonis TaxID=2495581 RepID=A0A3R9YQL9_9HYPH|nr:NUDIX hydrolase [Aquibium carbonis]RST84720.1 NUDIX hydrolase [Aquibium carbonis]
MTTIGFPEDQLLSAREVSLRLADGPHPYETLHADGIEENWQAERSRNATLFDGRTVLFSRVALSDGRLVGDCHDVRYASLLHWRLARRTDLAAHLFAMAMPVTADGAVLTVRMAPWTANAGQVYFAGGSFEPSDFVGGVADIDGNMLREVLEETGLDLAGERREALYRVIRSDRGVIVVRRYALAQTARELALRVRHFVAGETRPEIVEPVLVTRGSPPDPALLPWVRRIVDWHFATPFDE